MLIEGVLDRLAQKVPLKIDLDILEPSLSPPTPEQTKIAIDKLVFRMSRDAQKQAITETDFRAESEGEGVGDILFCRYELPDGKTLGASIITSKPDTSLVEADRLRREHADDSKVKGLLGLGEGAVPQLNDLGQRVGSMTIRPREAHPVMALFRRGTAGNPQKLGDETWTLFKVVRKGRVEMRLATDSSIVGPVHPNEEGTWSVPGPKLALLARQLEGAKFVEGRYIPKGQQEEDALASGTFF